MEERRRIIALEVGKLVEDKMVADDAQIGEKPGADVIYLQNEGDKALVNLQKGPGGKFEDVEFNAAIALGAKRGEYGWERSDQLLYRNKSNVIQKSSAEQMKVFSDTVDANDIR